VLPVVTLDRDRWPCSAPGRRATCYRIAAILAARRPRLEEQAGGDGCDERCYCGATGGQN